MYQTNVAVAQTKMNYIYLINAKTILQTPNQPDYAIVFVDKNGNSKQIYNVKYGFIYDYLTSKIFFPLKQ